MNMSIKNKFAIYIVLPSMLFFPFGIVTGNETVIPYDFFISSLAIWGTIIYSFNKYTSIPMTKALFSVII